MNRPLTALALGLATVSAQEPAKLASITVEPPPPAQEPVSDPAAPSMPHPRTTLWSIGNPTDQEQYYLELMNRARANPTAEGGRLAATTDPDVLQSYSYFGVNLAMMQSEMSALVVAPPLAMNARLLESSRGHSNDQFTAGFQGHTGSDGASIATRLSRVGYSSSYYAENVYAYSKNTWFGHAGFEVDWGSGPGGMQTARGHRAIIHAGFREVGIGIHDGSNGTFGPQVVTQDFGVPSGAVTPFVTGVAFYDFDGDNFYDPGEGIGGITVTVAGSSYSAVTASSGGYAVPVPEGAAQRAVTFSGLGFNGSATANLTGTNNTKVDFKPAYVPPAVSGASSVPAGSPAPYVVGTTGGASSYDWRAMPRTAAPFDGANDPARVNFSTYAWVNTSAKQEGTGSYQLTQPYGGTASVTYKSTLRAGTAPALQFQSLLATATSGQSAFVQVSTDNGATWTILNSQTGTNTSGQSAFSPRSVSLASVAGRDFLLRFALVLTGTTYNTGTGTGTGWYVDAVTFTDVLDTAGATTTAIPAGGAGFSFSPGATGTWLLSGRVIVAGRTLEFGPLLEVVALASSPTFASWAGGFETSAGLPAGTLANSPAADYNKDGVANLMAYALNLSPVSNVARSLPLPAVASGTLRLDYPRITDRADVSVVPQISANLVNWFTPGQAGAPAGFTDTALSSTGNVQTRRASIAAGSQRYYLRLKATKL